jgi:hypothetical protein
MFCRKFTAQVSPKSIEPEILKYLEEKTEMKDEL